MGPILAQIELLRCPSCNAQLSEGMVRGLSTEESRLLIRIACAGCGQTTLAIVEQVFEDVPEGQPFTRDDVLDAHDILKRFDGSPERLFKMAA
jgi:tRNA splicing ligase